MKKWETEIIAISPLDGQLKHYGGQTIEAPSEALAREYCELNGLGYLHILGEWIADIPCKEGTYEPDFSKEINNKHLEN